MVKYITALLLSLFLSMPAFAAGIDLNGDITLLPFTPDQTSGCQNSDCVAKYLVGTDLYILDKDGNSTLLRSNVAEVNETSGDLTSAADINGNDLTIRNDGTLVNIPASFTALGHGGGKVVGSDGARIGIFDVQTETVQLLGSAPGTTALGVLVDIQVGDEIEVVGGNADLQSFYMNVTTSDVIVGPTISSSFFDIFIENDIVFVENNYFSTDGLLTGSFDPKFRMLGSQLDFAYGIFEKTLGIFDLETGGMTASQDFAGLLFDVVFDGDDFQAFSLGSLKLYGGSYNASSSVPIPGAMFLLAAPIVLLKFVKRKPA